MQGVIGFRLQRVRDLEQVVDHARDDNEVFMKQLYPAVVKGNNLVAFKSVLDASNFEDEYLTAGMCKVQLKDDELSAIFHDNSVEVLSGLRKRGRVG
eukprot:4932437-Amphidinium_carterae.1